MYEHVDPDHSLAVMADIIDWDAIERVVLVLARLGPGQPAYLTGLIGGLLYLKHAYKLADNEMVALNRSGFRGGTNI